MNGAATKCDLARDRWRAAERDAKRWKNLLYYLGVMFAIICILAIIFDIARMTVAVGLLVSGGFGTWAGQQRAGAIQEEKDAFWLFLNTCGKESVDAAIEAGEVPAPRKRLRAEIERGTPTG